MNVIRLRIIKENDMSEELKMCPFCGKPAIEADNEIVYCSGRSCIVSFIKKEQWQSRPLEDALQAKLDNALRGSKENADWYDCLKIDYDKLQRKLDIAVEGLKNAKRVLKGSTTQEDLANLYDHINNKLAEIAKLEGE